MLSSGCLYVEPLFDVDAMGSSFSIKTNPLFVGNRNQDIGWKSETNIYTLELHRFFKLGGGLAGVFTKRTVKR